MEMEMGPCVPIPHALPHARQQARQHQRVEEALQDQRRALQIVAVDIDGGEGADGAARRHKQHPVPLRAAADGAPAPLARQEAPPVLAQVDQGEEHGGGEEGAEHQAGDAPRRDRVRRREARGGVGEGAVGEDICRGVRAEGEVAG